MTMTYEIVATLGPCSADEAAWKAMLSAGATAFRLNTSHLSLEQLQIWLERLEAFLSAGHYPAPLVLDLQGSKWRLGTFEPFELEGGLQVELVCASSTARPRTLPVPHPDFFQAAQQSGGEIVLNDAKVRLQVESTGADRLTARVLLGGSISPGKGITLPSSEFRKESLSDKDQAILETARRWAGIRFALSYVRDSCEMNSYRELFGPSAYLIAKLERKPALDDALEIARAADELWLCRGDLGAELGMRLMAGEVFRFSERVRSMPVPVLLAGQVLEHMVEQPAPTRSEVCYLHGLLMKGYRGFVLSDEAAIGRYPVESCRAAAMFKT